MRDAIRAKTGIFYNNTIIIYKIAIALLSIIFRVLHILYNCEIEIRMHFLNTFKCSCFAVTVKRNAQSMKPLQKAQVSYFVLFSRVYALEIDMPQFMLPPLATENPCMSWESISLPPRSSTKTVDT